MYFQFYCSYDTQSMQCVPVSSSDALPSSFMLYKKHKEKSRAIHDQRSYAIILLLLLSNFFFFFLLIYSISIHSGSFIHEFYRFMLLQQSNFPTGINTSIIFLYHLLLNILTASHCFCYSPWLFHLNLHHEEGLRCDSEGSNWGSLLKRLKKEKKNLYNEMADSG